MADRMTNGDRQKKKDRGRKGQSRVEFEKNRWNGLWDVKTVVTSKEPVSAAAFVM